jgi:hypothetical protein
MPPNRAYRVPLWPVRLLLVRQPFLESKKQLFLSLRFGTISNRARPAPMYDGDMSFIF